jgi:hypothetical protein
MSSYIIFCMDVRSIIEHQHPSMTAKNVSKEVARRWKMLNDDTKKLYKKKAIQDRKQYLIEKLKTPVTMLIEHTTEPIKKKDKERCNYNYLISFMITLIALYFFK